MMEKRDLLCASVDVHTVRRISTSPKPFTTVLKNFQIFVTPSFLFFVDLLNE